MMGDPGEERLREAESLFGEPDEVSLEQRLLPWELDLIERVCGRRRYHDVTVFPVRGSDLAVVHKPSEPAGVYWVPAGGVGPNESLAEGAEREAYEETGLRTRVTRYMLRARVTFVEGERRRPWTSHVMLAEHLAGEPDPVDRKEVESARWIPASQFLVEGVTLLRAVGWGRLAYRAWMAELVIPRWILPPGSSTMPG